MTDEIARERISTLKQHLIKAIEAHETALTNPNLSYQDYCMHRGALTAHKDNLIFFDVNFENLIIGERNE